MKPIRDQLQREQALEKSKSFIVQAPAGSGKTELLTQRFLALLTSVKQPEEIIAITFTKKSAGEMRTRIIHALTLAKHEPEPIATHAKKTWALAKQVLAQSDKLKWDLIKNPNRLRIQTIDSFNAYITKQLPILSNFGAPPNITDDSHRLYEATVREFLSHLEENLEWSESIAQLLVHLDNDLNKVEELLINMLAKRDQWLPYITLNAYDSDLRNTLEANLQAVTCDILTSLVNIFPKNLIDELLNLLRFAAYNLLNQNALSIITHCLDLMTLPGTDADDKHYWLAIAELLFTKEGEWRKRIDKNLGFPAPNNAINAEEKALYTSNKQRILTLINQLSEHSELKIAFENLCLSPDCYYQDMQWATLSELHHVLRIAVAQLKLIFQQHGEIDYIENAQAAVSALGAEDAPTDMTLALDYQIKHLLIDEFQDTSQSQFRLIEKLTAGWEDNDGRTLFLVGDPMQSIYRFREAEVGLFIRARKNGLGNIKLIPLTLSVNFRSVPGIVQWVNNHFEKIFPTFEDIAMGAVRYSHSIANADESQNDNLNVLLHPDITSDENHQANIILQLIKKRKQTHPHESIAILVRSRSHLTSIIPALKRSQVSYRAIDIDPLDTRPVIQDLMALTRALLHPADRIAWLTILRAPWCGISLHDLYTISNKHAHQCLWDILQSSNTIKLLSDDGQKRLARVIPIFKQAIADRHRYALRAWLEKCWLSIGGPAVVSHNSDLIDADAYFNLIDKLDVGGDSDINQLQTHVSQLFASPNNQADNSLQIMTIHNAKGLEFDTVILPHLERKSPNDDKQLLLWMERPQQNDTSALILAPVHAVGHKKDSIYDYIRRQHSIKSDYETARLLYVAATRAKKQLHLFFSLETDKNNQLYNPTGSSLLEKLWPSIKNQVLQNVPENILTSIPISIESELKKPMLQRLSLDWQHPIAAKPFETVHYQRKQTGFKLPNYQAKFLGTVIHELLQYLCKLGASWWFDKSDSVKENFLNMRFNQLGMQTCDIKSSIQYAKLAIQHTLSDERGLWIIQKHLHAESELKLTAVIHNKVKSLSIDRTFVDNNNIRWIIDFKTSIPDDIDVQTFLNSEVDKYQEQLNNYATTIKMIDSRPIRMGLYFPLIPTWRELIFITKGNQPT